MNRLNEIEARANAATEGPWEGIRYPDGLLGRVIASDELGVCIAEDFPDDADAEFIAHARTDVPDMAAAHRAVLELHVRAECPTCGSRDGEGNEFHKCDDDAYCEECDMEGYPCPTVAAIRHYLGDDL